MITDFILSTIGCPSEIVLLLSSVACPFLPLVVLYLSGKSINVRPKSDGSENKHWANLVGYILVSLYVVYACYAFMIPQALIGECH